jgi:hypothetical protein
MARKRRDMLAQRDLYTLAAILVFIAQGVLFRRFSFDDTYISYRYARHLGDGLGPVMNVGERVEGVSNLPWTGLLGFFAWLDLEPHTIAPVLSFVCGLAVLVVVSEIAASMIDDPRAGGPAALLVAASAPIAVWSVSGMETVAFTLLLTLLFLRAHRERQGRDAGWGTGLLLGAVASMRPEGIVYVVVLWLAAPRAWRWLAQVVAAAVVFIAPLELFRVLYYGDWLPNPVHAKATFGAAAFASGCVYGVKMIVAAPAHFGAALLLPRRGLLAPAAALLAGWIVTPCVLTVLSGGERVPGYRFLVPALPALAICVEIGVRRLRRATFGSGRLALGVSLAVALMAALVTVFPTLFTWPAAEVVGWLRTHRDASAHATRLVAETRFAAASLCAVALGVVVVLRQGAALRDLDPVEGSRVKRASVGTLVHESAAARRAMAIVLGWTLLVVALPVFLDPDLRAARRPDPAVRFGRPVGEWLRDNYPASTRVATNGAGSLPYFARLPVIDMLGLTDRHIARVVPDRSQWTGHEKGDGAYVLSRRPEIIILGGPEGSERAWPFPGDQQIAAAAIFRAAYRMRRVALDGFDFVFFERSDDDGAQAVAP